MTFILELANPLRKLIINKDEYKAYIKKWGGITCLYETIYKFTHLKNEYRPEYNSAIIDKLFFDFDSKNSQKITIKFHEHLKKENIKHYMKQSSLMRFHVFVCCKGTILNKKIATLKAYIKLCLDCEFTYGIGEKFDVDSSTFGDIARFSAIPGTYKPKRNSWCNYITEKDLYDEKKLLEKSKKFGGIITYYGENELDLESFDNEKIFHKQYNGYTFEKYKVKFNDRYEENLPPFIQKILLNYNNYGNWENRWRFVLYCREKGYDKEITNRIAKKYFSKIIREDYLKNNYYHFKKVKVLELAYKKTECKFPDYEKLIKEGYELETQDIKMFRELYL